MSSPVDSWDLAVEAAAVTLVVEHGYHKPDAPQLPPTGPEHLNVTRELVMSLAKVARLIEFQKERIKQMELGEDYTMVSKWARSAEALIESVGIGSIAMASVLERRGYGSSTPLEAHMSQVLKRFGSSSAPSGS